jgi:hypothetical protein
MSKTFSIRNKKPWDTIKGSKTDGERKDARFEKKAARSRDKQAMREYQRIGKRLS